MAFKMKGYSAFTKTDDDRKKLLELRDKYMKGDSKTRHSIIQKNLKKEK